MDLSEKTPDEIAEIHRDISPDVGNTELADGLIWSFMAGLEDLCARQPEVAANALEILATNATDHEERATAVPLLPHLARMNSSAALALAETLLRDAIEQVRHSALETVGEAFHEGSFTPQQALYLQRIHNTVDNTTLGETPWGVVHP